MKLLRITLSFLFVLFLTSSVGCAEPSGITITGTIAFAHYEGGVPSANVQLGEPASSVEVKLYTYKKPELLPQLPPIGDVLANTITDEQGKYQFKVQLENLPQGCDKLVVFVDGGIKGYHVIDVARGTIQVDLIKGTVSLT